MKEELKAVKDTEVFVLESGDFYKWEDVLNKYIKDMPSGFTSFYCFELVSGKVVMKKFCNEAVEEDDVMTKDLVENVDAVKSAILNEVFGRSGDATLTENLATPLKLPKLQSKPKPEKRLASIKKKYETIPREHLWYYPEGSEHNHDDNVEVEAKGLEIPLPRKKIGRPKTLPKDNKTPSILTFFKAFSVILNRKPMIISTSN